MCAVGLPRPDEPETGATVRHRRVPNRRLGDSVVIARPSDGTPVSLEGTAAFVWRLLDDWTSPAVIDSRLAETFPDVALDERVTARAAILRMLGDDDLLEPR
jgi:hypothetical protein